jgi:geranylgeranyl diphosphate synthase type 3
MTHLFVTETSSGLFLTVRLMQLFSENKDDFGKLTDMVGLYSQICDDYNDLLWQEVNSELLVSDI